MSTARAYLGFSLFTLAMLAVLLSLGFWQLQRRAAEACVDRSAEGAACHSARAVAAVASWSTLNPAKDEFRRVSFSATYAKLPDAMIYSSGSAVRDDISGPGTWAFLPARLPDGDTVAINTGFVQNTMQDRAQQDRAVGRLITGEPVKLTGYIRFPESRGALTPAENPAKRLWFVRDHLAMARALGWGEGGKQSRRSTSIWNRRVPDSGIPKPGPLHVRLKDDHLQYAITWFRLAAAVLIAFGVWWRAQRRG